MQAVSNLPLCMGVLTAIFVGVSISCQISKKFKCVSNVLTSFPPLHSSDQWSLQRRVHYLYSICTSFPGSFHSLGSESLLHWAFQCLCNSQFSYLFYGNAFLNDTIAPLRFINRAIPAKKEVFPTLGWLAMNFPYLNLIVTLDLGWMSSHAGCHYLIVSKLQVIPTTAGMRGSLKQRQSMWNRQLLSFRFKHSKNLSL